MTPTETKAAAEVMLGPEMNSEQIAKETAEKMRQHAKEWFNGWWENGSYHQELVALIQQAIERAIGGEGREAASVASGEAIQKLRDERKRHGQPTPQAAVETPVLSNQELRLAAEAITDQWYDGCADSACCKVDLDRLTDRIEKLVHWQQRAEALEREIGKALERRIK